MNLRVNYKVEDFLKDDSFIHYILDVSPGVLLRTSWRNLLEKHPDLAKKAEKAKSILTGEDCLYELTPSESDALKGRIMDDVLGVS